MSILFAIIHTTSCTISPIVQTPNGRIQGVHSTSYEGCTYSAFIGIPYAAPPIGPLRFKMMSDRLFIYRAEQAARLTARVKKSPVYFYYYSYTGEKVDTYAWHYTGLEVKYGVCHGDDVMFFMSNPKKPMSKMTESNNKIRLLFLDMWSSFAKNGIPMINTGVSWLPVSKDDEEFVYLHIASPKSIKMENTAELGERTFWENFNFRG